MNAGSVGECCAVSADGGLYMKTAPEGLHQEK